MSLHQTPSHTGRENPDITLVGGAAACPQHHHDPARVVGPEDAPNPSLLRLSYLQHGRAELWQHLASAGAFLTAMEKFSSPEACAAP